MLMRKDQLKIGILTFPTLRSGSVPLANLIDILRPILNDIYLITGNREYIYFKDTEKVHIYGIKHKTGANKVNRIVNYIFTQIKISYEVLLINKNVTHWLFFLGGPPLALPMLSAKLAGKDVSLIFAGSDIETVKAESIILSKLVEILVKINLTLSNHIIIYSSNLIKEWGLEKYKNKIYIAHEHFLDFNMLKVRKKLDERENLVGYIGRLSEEKGVLKFVKTIPEIIKEKDDLKFLIGGEGQLQDKIEKYLSKKKINNKVKLAGWIPHNELPDYLNKLKLVVIPSYTEGLPNLMLEAMACGTPVLATPVGAIPDVIKDGETGFIMKNNSPECIAENVVRALEHSDVEWIVENAMALVEQEYTYVAAVERYRTILEEI
uniref:D-inositol-3-phosphate glycosyltransferase n=1 Tax=Candidatus Methanogaster sp. ANME-2c ERB4 TaxID=2759911 RepID=A0A7G9YE71_9EURY|nr:D-inositol-3-phosphate glycosyltransferase [Methanosarcinales archaeon ANME-2c ERB4]